MELPATIAPLRQAATLVVMRDSPAGLEVLLLRRAERGDHSSGAWVFPGGVLDARDRDGHPHCGALDDTAASRLLGVSDGALDYYVAALRECFEEAGLLLAYRPDGSLVRLDDDHGQAMRAWRSRLHAGEVSMAQFCTHFGLTLATDRIAYYTRWVTPAIRAKRWDTRFFFAEAPQAQESVHDEVELVEQLWLTPAEAIRRGDALKLLGPTRVTLETLARFERAQQMLDHARETRSVALPAPRIADGPHGMMPVPAEHPSWAEVGRLDPQGHGLARYAIEPGRPVRLSPHLIRVTAPNPGMMTGPGTNSYLVGGGPRNTWAVIDPGPDLPVHVEALLAAAPGPITAILVTHTHPDHSPAAASLAARTGAPVLGRIADHAANQDPGFRPAREPVHDERIAVDEGLVLRVIHTPGHASNHLCFLLESERTLFTGDHLMGASTVVIGPPDGDMSAYLDSLRALLPRPIDWLAPGHGFLMAEPHRIIEGVVRHRLAREAKVVTALRELGPADLPTLLARVYDDVRPELHPVAARSLTAHLIKLRRDGLAMSEAEHWRLLTAA
jgi:glyoxylase-like metal-dependent hydrolase (beta-lactamase superfamily II)/8-oxo-dGTP pyrophosphatase MutT (NUDIX family)